jgi:hypothetical protein
LFAVIRTTCVDILKELCVSVEIVVHGGGRATDLNSGKDELGWLTIGMAPDKMKVPKVQHRTVQPYFSWRNPLRTGPTRVPATIAQVKRPWDCA